VRGQVPPHRDPDALQEAYEQCDTFAEMKRALGTDVTPEAVRQQMVKHGIHEVPDESGHQIADENEREAKPTANAQSSSAEDTKERPPDSSDDSGESESIDGSEESPAVSEESSQTDAAPSTEVVVSDGGFQADFTVEEIQNIVQSSQTLHEATQKLHVDREEAREMLKHLDLLDLVTGRLSTKSERQVTSEEIERRIRSSNLTTA